MGDEPQHRKRGRGAGLNPAGRFEPVEVEADPESAGEEEPLPATSFLDDASRSIITRNTSPDIPFEASLNPYRGCEHGCAYCLSGDTPVLMADGRTRRLGDLRVGDEIYGTVRDGWHRRYTKTRVLAHWSTVKRAYRVTLEDGTRLISSGDHRFLTERGWRFVTGAARGDRQRPHLISNSKLVGSGPFASRPRKGRDYRRGYLCGLIRGDGHPASYEYKLNGRAHGDRHRFRLALSDEEALQRARRYLPEREVPTRELVFQKAVAGGKDLRAARTPALGSADLVRETVAWPETASEEWSQGFLAGIFDAEGSYGGGALRIANTDPEIVDRILRSLELLGFAPVLEERAEARMNPLEVVRIRGGLREHLRFFHTVDPAISRKRDISGQAVKNGDDLRVAAIEPLGIMPLYDITTGTGDFIADGVVSHNCYARPTHEYLGLSAGLDFESKILVKRDAPQLLRRDLSSRTWEPKTLSMSGVTDPYQPVERRLEITRGCLEVLAEARNPVAVVTKNHLVTRDADLLAELARHDAASVAISLTTLDDDLRRCMEPRTSSPKRRLAAIERLAGAGVPVGVMTAPIIPGLNDHELPELLSRAAEAGAQFAGYTVVRLPGAVAPLFEDWLERNLPDRKEKVLNRLRSMRGGKLNDPRFGSRMRGEDIFADQIRQLFEISRRRAGIGEGRRSLSTAAFQRPDPQGGQPRLF